MEDLRVDEIVVSATDATENRGQLPLWTDIGNSNPDRMIWITQADDAHASIQCGNNEKSLISLRDDQALDSYFSQKKILIDISGLQHHVWAPILKSAHRLKLHTRMMYAEPMSYRIHPSPASSTVFDLSSTIGGLSPLPGFARLAGPEDDTKCIFVAMLGFEGNRPERLALQIDPPPKVIPVVGVPGFQLEYPAFTISCNTGLLDDYKAHSEIRYARASCPFSAMHVLRDIKRSYPNHYMYLAPVGTKPHALGTILFAILNPETTEIMFDHPIRKAGRTSGVGLIHIYDFGDFSEY
jgi:hypothetical protein